VTDSGSKSVWTDAIDAAPVAIFVADADMRYIAVNATACELVGYTRDELLRMTVTDIAHSGHATVLYEEMVETGWQAGIIPLRHKDGGTIIVRYYASAIPDRDPAAYVSVVVPRRTIPAGVSPQEAAARGPRMRGGDQPTAREVEILELVADGLDNDEIARRLFVSVDTVKSHVRRLIQRLGARNRTHAVAVALRRNLID
jgi:PAS domain S-box-containing protein